MARNHISENGLDRSVGGGGGGGAGDVGGDW